MTTEHDEAVRLAERYARSKEVGGAGHNAYRFSPSQLAALIADVRRQAMDEFLSVCKEADYFNDVFDSIRDRLEEGK